MEFFIIKNDEQLGPFTIDKLGGMDIQPDTPVWYKGLDNWTVAGKVEELRDLLVYKPQSDASEEKTDANLDREIPHISNESDEPATPAAAMEPSKGQALPEAATKPKKSRTGLWVTLGIVGLLTIVLAVSNPNKESHCSEINSVSQSWVTETVDGYHMNNLAGGLIKTASTWLVRSAIEENVQVKNYFLFSIGQIDSGGEKTRVSFGILGNVFTFNKDKLDEKVKEIMTQYINDAVEMGDFFSFDIGSGNINDALIEGIVQLIGGNLIDGGGSDSISGSEDQVDAEDRADAALTPPSTGERVMKEVVKAVIKKGADYLMDKVDNIGN